MWPQKDETKVAMPRQWAKRRAEILDDFSFSEYRQRSYRASPFCDSLEPPLDESPSLSRFWRAGAG
jgi:hypothetical protein